MNFFEDGLKKLSIEIDREEMEKFSEFLDYIKNWGKRVGLTSIDNVQDIIVNHFLDSLIVLKYVRFGRDVVLDIGTGAGFPSIPIAILSGKTRFELVDSKWKSERFVKNVVEIVGLKNVFFKRMFLNKKVSLDMNGKYNYILNRAVGSLRFVVDICFDLLKESGKIICYKGRILKSEIDELMRKNRQKFKIRIENIEIPFQEKERNLVFIEKL